MILTLAWKNLFHDKVRFAVTLTGVVFAAVLITVQVGLYHGFTTTTSSIIDHSPADIWIASAGVRNFDITTPLKENKYYRALSVPGVLWADHFIIWFANWKKPLGGEESVELVGFNLNEGRGGPWGLTRGNLSDLHAPDTVIVDELYAEKLGVTELGGRAEINGRRARVVGFTRGIRSFTTSPFVFTSFKNAQRFAKFPEDQMTYILVKARPGTDPAALKAALSAQVGSVDVFTTPEFSARTQDYWMFTTGAGLSVLIAAALGLVVGTVIVAQTLYATTMDHLPEFGTMRAMGAPGRYIHGIIIAQAVISAVIGYALALCVSLSIVGLAEKSGAAILLTAPMAAWLFVLTLAMCVAASYVSIFKVTRIDPAMVFKG